MTTTILPRFKVCPFRSSPDGELHSVNCPFDHIDSPPYLVAEASGSAWAASPSPITRAWQRPTDIHGNRRATSALLFSSPSFLPFTCFPVPTRSQSSDMTASPSLRSVLSPATEGRPRPTQHVVLHRVLASGRIHPAGPLSQAVTHLHT